MKICSRICLMLVMLCIVVCGYAQQTNHPFPQNPKTLRILGVGNSFTDDGTEYFPQLLEAAGIKNVVLGRLYIGGCSLERHCKEYADSIGRYRYSKSTENKWNIVSKESTIQYGLEDEPWDIIVLQQASGVSGIYSSYKPWLDNLIAIVQKHCSNKNVSIVWQQTWAYARTSNHGEFPKYGCNQKQMYQSILFANKKMMEESIINYMIPSGTTIQLLRQSNLCDSQDLTRDGFHLSLLHGRYAAACTWFQALLGPTLNLNIQGNPFHLQGTQYEISVKDAEICQAAARLACEINWNTWMSGEILP